jgi:hypothetical protein
LWDGFRNFVVMKIFLKTKTVDLTSRQLRQIVGECIRFMESNGGTKPSRQKTLKYRVINCKVPNYGNYDYKNNTITIHRNYTTDVKMVIRTVLHEYAHFLQNLRNYHVLLKKVGYDNHPLEREANEMETLYPKCWKQIKKYI